MQATCACTQFAWSPDGNAILYTTGTSFTILPLNQQQAFTFHADQESTPSWSPDGRFLLLNSPRSLVLIDVAHQHAQVLLSSPANIAKGQLGNAADSKALLQPLPNSPWAADSQHFLFLTQQRLSWQGKRLAQGEGLYTVSLTPDGGLGVPTLVATGAISQPGWTYQDPNTSFLF